jgi:glycine betaine/proline transport system permease protein
MAGPVPTRSLALQGAPAGSWRATPGAIWLAALAVFALLWLAAGDILPWAFDYPRAWQWPLARWINGFMGWLVNDAAIGPVRFTDLTRALAGIIEIPYRAALAFLASGLLSGQGSDAVQILPRCPGSRSSASWRCSATRPAARNWRCWPAPASPSSPPSGNGSRPW